MENVTSNRINVIILSPCITRIPYLLYQISMDDEPRPEIVKKRHVIPEKEKGRKTKHLKTQPRIPYF